MWKFPKTYVRLLLNIELGLFWYGGTDFWIKFDAATEIKTKNTNFPKISNPEIVEICQNTFFKQLTKSAPNRSIFTEMPTFLACDSI